MTETKDPKGFEEWCEIEYPKISGPFQDDREMCFTAYRAGMLKAAEIMQDEAIRTAIGDGYDYNSGVEYGLRSGGIKIVKAAGHQSAQSQHTDGEE